MGTRGRCKLQIVCHIRRITFTTPSVYPWQQIAAIAAIVVVVRTRSHRIVRRRALPTILVVVVAATYICRPVLLPAPAAPAAPATASAPAFGAIELRSLRSSVTNKAEDVWQLRHGVDLYTQLSKSTVQQLKPQVDHCIEVQLIENSLVDALIHTGLATSAAENVEGCRSALAKAFNGTLNLNVTTQRVNQQKRGPFTAGIRRLYGSGSGSGSGTSRCLRVLTLEQLARQGRAQNLVDDGTWARIEKTVAVAFDSVGPVARQSLPESGRQSEICDDTLERLQDALVKLGVL